MSIQQFRISCAMALLLLGLGPFSTLLHAQAEGELIYKFTVQGITEPGVAKGLQAQLLQHAGMSSCTFIDACDCFKLSTTEVLDHSALRSLLQSCGQVLTGPVEVSDGTVLTAPTTTPLIPER